MENGKHIARCLGASEVTFGVSSKGNLQIAIPFEITKGAAQGETISYVGNFAEGRGTEMTIEALQNCGWRGTDPTADLTGIDANEVELVIITETATDEQGHTKEYKKVKFVNRPGSGRITFKKPATGDTLRAFGAEIAQTVNAMRADNGQRRPAQPRQAPQPRSNPLPRNQYNDTDYGQPPSDDDFPF